MKTLIATASAFLAAALIATAAEDKHDHGKSGPTGGRLITAVEPHAEFLVTKENKVEIRFFDEENKAVAPGDQSVSVIMGDRSAPTKIAFAKEGDKLVSDKAIPSGDDLPTVVQIKGADGKTVTEKFNLNLKDCPDCKHKEYACSCEHGDEKK